MQREAAGSNLWTAVTTTAVGVTSFTDTTVTPGTQYQYRVCATEAAGNTAYSPVQIVTTPSGAPINLAVTVQSAYAVSLTWTNTADSGAQFLIEREVAGSASWTLLTTTAAGATSFTDTTVTPGTQYQYGVCSTEASANAGLLLPTEASGSAGPSLAPAGATMAANTLATGGRNSAYVFSQTVTTAAVLTPGTGFTGATVQPAALGQPGQDMYNENAIARWDVVPYQTFSGTFNVGVVAFDSAGIKEVDFSVNGGAWVAVTTMTLNPQTANTGDAGNPSAGVVEYWATLNAADFADGQIEVRAIAVPVVGQPRVLQGATVGQSDGVESLFLNADAQGSLPHLVRYVSPTGNDATGDGSAGNPFASISAAMKSMDPTDTGGGTAGATIYLTAGSYLYGIIGNWDVFTATTNQWLTITTAPGVSRDRVKLTGSTQNPGMYSKYVHLKNLTITSNTVITMSSGYKAYLWVDGCNLAGPGVNVDGDWTNGSWTGEYFTDSEASNCKNGFITANLVRNCYAHNLGSWSFANDGLLVNGLADNINQPAGTGWHPNVDYSERPNAITYGLVATNNIARKDCIMKAMFR